MSHFANVSFWITALVGGVVGGLAMEAVLWVIGAGGWAKADMVVALGSLITRRPRRLRPRRRTRGVVRARLSRLGLM